MGCGRVWQGEIDCSQIASQAFRRNRLLDLGGSFFDGKGCEHCHVLNEPAQGEVGLATRRAAL